MNKQRKIKWKHELDDMIVFVNENSVIANTHRGIRKRITWKLAENDIR